MSIVSLCWSSINTPTHVVIEHLNPAWDIIQVCIGVKVIGESLRERFGRRAILPLWGRKVA